MKDPGILHEDALQALRSLPESRGQRDFAGKMGWSLGKAHYVLTALMEKGWVKVDRFVTSKHKAGYRYILTNDGAKRKLDLAREFVAKKKKEYEELEREVRQMEDQWQGPI